MTQMTYAEADRKYIGLIKTKASKWSSRGAGPFDDLVQEGRCELAKAITSYDSSRGPLIKYLGVILDNRYRTLRAAALAQIRTPHIWEKDLDTGRWERVPSSPTPLSAYDNGDNNHMDLLVGHHRAAQDALSTNRNADVESVEREDRACLAKWKRILENRLSDRQRQVYQCIARPSPALSALVRNMTGEEGGPATIPHIAVHLGLTKNQVDYALHGVRIVAEGLFIETDDVSVESIRRVLSRSHR